MKKLLLSLLICTMIISTGISQSLSLSDANGPISHNGTVFVEGDVNTTLVAYVFVTNNSGATITVGCKKEHISVIAGTENTLCWGNCFDTSTYVSPIQIPIAGGATNNMDFIGDYKAHGIVGKSTIKYTFYDFANPTDEVSVNVEYSGITIGIDELLDEVDFSDAYPNPATNRVTFEYSLPVGVNEARIIIRDILGNTVKKSLISDKEGKLIVNTENLTNGMYFYSVIVNEKMISSRKLIINR